MSVRLPTPVSLVALALTGLLSRCAGSPARDARCTPADIGDILVRIERRLENESAFGLLHQLEQRGLRAPAAAVYEFTFMRDKPVFYLAIGRGDADRASLLAEALASVGGTPRPDESPAEHHTPDGTFLCRSFTRSRGLVGRSGACAFSERGIAGYGVRTDGGEVEDTLKYTAEARRRYARRVEGASVVCPDAALLAERARPASDAAGVARDVVAAVLGFKCARLAQFYPAGAEDLFRSSIGKDLLLGSKDSLERVCFVLGTLGFPSSEDMHIRTVSETPDRVRLRLTDPPWRLARTAGTELVLVSEGDTWKVDPQWALGHVQDLAVRLPLLSAASNLQGYRGAAGRFSADAAEVTRRTRSVMNFVPGTATPASPPGTIYLELPAHGRIACLSTRSRSGNVLIVRVDDEGVAYGRTGEPVKGCAAGA